MNENRFVMESNKDVLDKMKQALGTVLTSIEICPTHITPKLNGVALGEIPYTLVGGIYQPKLDSDVLEKLDWSHVCFWQRANIKSSITEKFGDRFKDIRVGDWGHLTLHETETSEPLLVQCIYDGKEWQISEVE